MLEKIREGAQGPTAKIILVLVILSFALAGIGGYLGQTANPPVATVNGQEIGQITFSRAYENERARLEQQFGDYFAQIAADPAYMARVRQSVIERLVQQELQSQLAEELGLRVSDEALKEEIRKLPAFQLGGQFNNDLYLQRLRQMNFQPNAFRDYLRQDMTRAQLVSAIAASDFALENEVKRTVALLQQSRDIDMAVIAKDAFKADITVTDEEIAEFYTLNQNQFMAAEQVEVAYVELDANKIELADAVTDADIQQYYDDRKAQYTEVERRRVSHILIEGDDAEAQEKAQALLARVKQGEDFAAIAEAESDDVVSAEMGGDLDWIEKDMMDPAFEEAAFALAEVGAVSEVVETEFGLHIIKLTELQAGEVKPLSEVRDAIVSELKKEQQLDEFYALQTELAQTAFEISDSLEEAAIAAKQTVQTTGLVAKSALPAPLNTPQVQTVIFSPEVLEDGVNSELVELGDEHVIVVRVLSHKPAAVKPLDEVKAEIQASLVDSKATEQATQLADALLAQLAEQPLSEVAAANNLTVEAKSITRQGFGNDAQLVKAVFEMPATANTHDSVTLASGDVALVTLKAVNTPELDEVNEQIVQSIESQTVNLHYQTFVEALSDRAEVTRVPVTVSE